MGEKEKEEKKKKSVCSWVVVQSKAAMVCLGWMIKNLGCGLQNQLQQV